MISDDFFILTVTDGSVLHRADGSSIVLNEIPENAFDIWKDGSPVFCLRKAGYDKLKSLSKDELEAILQKRNAHDYKIEIQLIRKALKDV